MKRIGIVVAVLLALVAAAAFWGWRWLDQPLAVAGGKVELEVTREMSPRDIAEGWVAKGVQAPGWALYEWFKWSGDAKRIKVGTYEAPQGITPRGLLGKMVRGETAMARVRFIEGWNFRELRAALAEAPNMRVTTAKMSEAQLMEAIGRKGVHPEGRFFPDTYLYARGATDVQVLKRAADAMDKRVADVWARRPADSPLKTPQDLLTLASIVEKETGQADDRDKVAAVFLNRMRIGMPLQTDPTVIYGVGESFDGNLTKKHLQTDTPYNTYTRRGLPPTPISLAGQASLNAVVAPAATRALYFVARGDGSSEFSENLSAHNRAVSRYQLGQGASR